jgi:ABC-type glycerol-3-phosphate transport system permease component
MLNVILMVGLVIFLLAIGPFLVIWSWNTLFGAMLMIPYGLETWCATVLIGAFLRANVTVKRKD